MVFAVAVAKHKETKQTLTVLISYWKNIKHPINQINDISGETKERKQAFIVPGFWSYGFVDQSVGDIVTINVMMLRFELNEILEAIAICWRS